MSNIFLSKWYAEILNTKVADNTTEKLSKTLLGSKIKLTPHQIEAALFALKSPLEKGVILADEVGLGKTIEAGIVIAQYWHETKSKILIISPASLMKQWQNELQDKFMLNSIIVDRKKYNNDKNQYNISSFMLHSSILICSIQFASIMASDIENANFDLVVIDEAHKLRNIHTNKTVIAENISNAIKNSKKLLLTATPIQNSLLDILGLTNIINPNIFPSKKIFNENYIKNYNDNKEELSIRLNSIIHRTLRNDVKPYINFTKRITKTFDFYQTAEEEEIYNLIREILYINSTESYIIPNNQRHLLVLILSKLLSSSYYALESTLQTIHKRLILLKNPEVFLSNKKPNYLTNDIDYQVIEDQTLLDSEEINNESITTVDHDILEKEIALISNIISKINNLKIDSKFDALVNAINYSFNYLSNNSAPKKVLIFTESKKTQEYLFKMLQTKGFNKIVLFNGSNDDENSKKIYQRWAERKDPKLLTNKNVNMRQAILDEFKTNSEILISTEAGAEGLNMQFCSLVINYDLPWNPQRVEQRIGRVHRFGQKHDVVVINLINLTNKIEQRVYELLSTKFKVFDEVFGSSDDILGRLDDTSNIEKSLINIYSNCRTESEIDEAFNNIQKEFKDKINTAVKTAQKDLFENFDYDVQKHFETILINTEKNLNYIETIFWFILKNSFIKNYTVFDDNKYSFKVINNSEFDGEYQLSSRNTDNKYLDININTIFGKKILDDIMNNLNKEGKILCESSEGNNVRHKKGFISLNKYTYNFLDKEEYLQFNGITADGKFLDHNYCKDILKLNILKESYYNIPKEIRKTIENDIEVINARLFNQTLSSTNSYIAEEINRINNWADDQIQDIEYKVEQLRNKRTMLQKQYDLANNIIERDKLENQLTDVTKNIKKLWLKLAESEETIEVERQNKISELKIKHNQDNNVENIFTVEFEVL